MNGYYIGNERIVRGSRPERTASIDNAMRARVVNKDVIPPPQPKREEQQSAPPEEKKPKQVRQGPQRMGKKPMKAVERDSAGRILAEYDSARMAASARGVTYGAMVMRCRKNSLVGGVRWEYVRAAQQAAPPKKEPRAGDSIRKTGPGNACKAVLEKDRDGTIVNKHISAKKAAAAAKMHYVTMCRYIRTGRVLDGHTWEYEKEG